MESGHKSGGGSAAGERGAAGGGDGLLCHACGYQYPNGHPSAKQRRAHRKHCGKPASAAAVEEGAGEHEGAESLPGGGGGGAGDGIGASATGCGGGLPGSAPEAASAVDGGDNNAEYSSGNGTGHQVIRDECTEDRLISSSNIPSEIISEAGRTDDDTLTTVDTQHCKKGTPIEDGDPSDPAVGSEQLEGVTTSVRSPEPEDAAKCSSEISELEKQNMLSEYETQNSTVDDGTFESNATGGGASEQPDVVSQVDAVTEEDDTINTIGKNRFSEDKSTDGDDFDLSCQENQHTKTGEGYSSIVVVEESYDKNLSAIYNKEVSSDEVESNQQSKHMITDSFENIANIDVPVESSTEKSVGTEDDMLKLGMVGSHSETPDVKPQQQLDSTSETEGHLAVSEGADNVDEQHYPISEGGIPALPSAFGPAVTANVIENICSSGVAMDGSMQQNVTGGTVVTSQVDVVELSTPTIPNEINMVASTNTVDEIRQNEKDGIDLTSYGGNELHIVENFEEKQENKEVIVDPIPHEANTLSSVVQSISSAEEKEQIEGFIANLAPEVTSVTNSRDIVEEKQGEIDVKTSEVDGARSTETAGENNAATWEINAGTNTDDVEDKAQNEEFATDPISAGINMICSSSNEGKMHKEEVTESLGSHENIVVHGTDGVEEKMIEETMVDATSHKFSLVTSTDSVEERKDDETNADPTLLKRSAVHTIDNIDEKNEQPVLHPTTMTATISSIGDFEEKKHIEEETTTDPSSGESNVLPGTDDAEAENSKKKEDIATTGPATTNVVEEIGKTEDSVSKEISTIESTDDQNEEIADKEMVMDLDKNHVSLKVLLADKNVETKEKEKKTSTKDRVLSFKRRSSKDSVSPVKPGSPKDSSGQQDWNSPARLPVEKKPKGRKQQWVPFICCSSVQ